MKITKLKGGRTKPYMVRITVGSKRQAFFFGTKREALEFKLRSKSEPSILDEA